MRKMDFTTLYHRFGPLLFSHFLRNLGDERQAMKATRSAFEELAGLEFENEREVVQWIRRRPTPAQVTQTDALPPRHTLTSSSTWNATCGALRAAVMRLMRRNRASSALANHTPSSPVVLPCTARKKSPA